MSILMPTKNALSLAEFKRNSAELIEELEETGRPLLLNVDDKVRLIVLEEAAYERLLDLAEQQELITGIQESLDSMRRGEGVPLEDFKKKMHEKYGLPMERPSGK